MIGILCEKPSAARNFANALGGMRGQYNGESYMIVAARGHLYGFKKPHEQVSSAQSSWYESWDMTHLPWNERDFQWKYEMLKDASSTLKDIKGVLSGCDEVVIATDVDPSGEGYLLAAEILIEQNIRPKKFSRMYFMDEAPASIQKAFKTRKVIPHLIMDPEYLMSYYRSRWDLLSMQFTRIATLCVHRKGVLRQGRLKSAMVVIVGDGLKALADYKPVPYYFNRFKDENGVLYTNPDEERFADASLVPQKYHGSDVVKDSVTLKHTVPPKLIDLATLSARLASKGFSSKVVLDTYQAMYEAQVVSYPRTEDKVITPEQFNELLPKVNDIASVVGVDPKILTHRQPRATHVKTGGAHGANRPGINVPHSLSDLAKYDKAGASGCASAIYEILARCYLAMLAEDYDYEEQKGHVKDYPMFVGKANIPKFVGWKAIYGDDDPDDDEDNNAKGIGTFADPFVDKGVNPKPPTPTMKWLMKQLEKHDVGTGATRTSTYAEVTNAKTQYPLLKDTRGKISMTEFGEMSYMLLSGTHIGSLDLTEKVMRDMKLISQGKMSPDVGLHEIQQLVLDDIDVMMKNANQVATKFSIAAGNVGYPDKEKYSGVWNGQSVEFNRTWSGYRFTDDECSRLCKGEEIVVKNVVSRDGSRTYNVKGRLSNQAFKGKKFVGFESLGYVNDDGSDVASSSSSEYCSGKWKRKDVRFKRTWGGHYFTDDECAMLLKGESITIEAVSQRTGNKYMATGKLAKQKFNGNEFIGFKPDFN